MSSVVVDAVEHLVRGIVDNPDDVRVDMVTNRRGRTVEVHVNPEDLGKVIGRAVGSVADFKYGDGMLAVGAAGKVWDEASVAAYVVDPAAWLAANGGGDGAKSKMSFKLASGGEDVAAYLATIQ